MRNFIDRVEATQPKHWTDYPSMTIDQLDGLRELFLAEPGVDVEFAEMFNFLPSIISDDDDENAIMAKMFDFLIAKFRSISNTGTVRVYRAISVKSVDKFLAKIEQGKEVGNHWSNNSDCASTEYHSYMPHEYDLMLVADAPAASIDWGSSMQAHFSHPNEEELYITGRVKILEVWDNHTGETVAKPNCIVKT